MRARTPMALLFGFAFFAPLGAHAAPHVIAQMTGVLTPFNQALSAAFALNDPALFVATGTLSDLVLPLSSTFGQEGDYTLGARLVNARQETLDCATPIKTIDEWGVTHTAGDPDAPMVDIGPFSGSQCEIGVGTDGHDVAVQFVYGSAPDDIHINGGIVVMGTDGTFDYTAHADGVSARSGASSVLFIPGMASSRLYTKLPLGLDLPIWEPNNNFDAGLLDMNEDGTSAVQIYTRDIIDSLYKGLVGDGIQDVYGNFEQFMDGLVAAGTIAEWRAYPYDWRYDPQDIVRDGTLTEMPDGSLAQVHLEDVVKELAAGSASGKVSIVAHSNGGLLAKALASAMGSAAANYIDRIVLIGVPEFGTPQDIETMLHGDGETYLGGLVLYGGDAREATRDIPGLYGLLPSPAYFSSATAPVALFESGARSGAYASAYGATIDTSTAFNNFLTDISGVGAQLGSARDISIPLVLSPQLLNKAATTHATLDAWTPPPGIAVTSIAGVGQPTNATVVYSTLEDAYTCDRDGLFSLTVCNVQPHLRHGSIETEQGDGTVVATSAAWGVSNAWYLDLGQYAASSGVNIEHRGLMGALPIQQAIAQLLAGNSPTSAFLAQAAPVIATDEATTITVESTAESGITATDDQGRESGIVAVPGASGIYYEKHDAPGVSVETNTDGQSVTVAKSKSYSVKVKSTKVGKAKIKVSKRSSTGVATTTATYQDIPITASTTITITVHNGTDSLPVVDENGDGQNVFTVGTSTPSGFPTLTIPEQLHELFSTLEVRPGVKNRLLRALEPLEADETDQTAVANLEILVKAQAGVKLTLEQGAEALQLLAMLRR